MNTGWGIHFDSRAEHSAACSFASLLIRQRLVCSVSFGVLSFGSVSFGSVSIGCVSHLAASRSAASLILPADARGHMSIARVRRAGELQRQRVAAGGSVWPAFHFPGVDSSADWSTTRSALGVASPPSTEKRCVCWTRGGATGLNMSRFVNAIKPFLSNDKIY